jgi:bacterioferritin
MKGNPKVLKELNAALQEELTAINQYFLHAEMCENFGYKKLSDYIKKQSIDEMKHAEVLIERILFLDGSPTMKPLELKVGGNVQQMLQSDLELELSAVSYKRRPRDDSPSGSGPARRLDPSAERHRADIAVQPEA